MKFSVKRGDQEIADQFDRAEAGVNAGSRYSGMSFEQGVFYALMWLFGLSDDAPMPDDD